MFEQVRAVVPAPGANSARSINWSNSATTAGDFRSLRRVYTYADQTLTVTAQAKVYEDGTARLTGLHVHALQNSEVPDTSFTFKDKSVAQIALAAAFALNAVFMIGTGVLALFRRRWAWAAAALLGVTKIQLNWLTGLIGFHLVVVRFELFGISFVKGMGPLDPWILTSTIPAGALMFWICGKWRPKEPRVPRVRDSRWTLTPKEALPPGEDSSKSSP